MSESYILKRFAISTVLAIGALSATSCGALGIHDGAATAPLSRCYDEPLPVPTRGSTSLPELVVPAVTPDGYISGDPIYDRTIVGNTIDGIVRIDTGDEHTSGSGFIAQDKEGDEVVVTAAHVPRDVPLDQLTVTTDDGSTHRAVDGCYIFEDKGAFKSISEAASSESVIDYDIAVLELADSAKAVPLAISQPPAKRGGWTYLVNYQGDHTPGNPAFYSGQVLTEPAGMQGFRVVTGLERMHTPVTQEELWGNTVQPGASGGPVIDAISGKVLGISTTTSTAYYDSISLKDRYNVEYPGAQFTQENGRWPIVAGVMSAELIEKALDAPVLAN